MSCKTIYINLLLSICLVTNFANAQNSDYKKAGKYFDLFQSYEYEDFRLAKKYVDSGLFFAIKSKNPTMIGRGYQFKGWYFQDRARYSEANNCFFKSLAYLRKAKDKQGIADAYGNLGNSFYDMGEYQKSLDFQLLSLQENEKILKEKKKSEKHAALQGQTFALHNIGTIYNAIGMYDKALEYELRSLPYEIISGNKQGEAISYTTLAALYDNLNKIDSAEYYYKKALTKCDANNYRDNYAATIQGYAALSKSSLTKKQKSKMLHEALEIRRDLNDLNGEGQVLLDICESQFDFLTKDSLSILFRSLDKLLNSTTELDFLKEKYYKLYAKYASKVGDFNNAYFSLENFVELKELSDEKRRAQDLIAGDIKLQLQNKNFNDSIQFENNFAVERAEYHQEISKIQNIVYLSIIGFIILTVSLFIFINSNRRKRKLNDLLSEKNHLIYEQMAIVDEKNQSISDSISYAQRLQRAILPTRDEINKYLPDSFLFFLPKDNVSGDFYWFEVKGDLIFVAVADCTGHGVPGAMMSVVCSDALSRSMNEFKLDQPKDILDKTRELVIQKFEKSSENVSDGMDISLISIDLKKLSIVFSGANNPLCVVRRNDNFTNELNISDNITKGEYFSLIEFNGDKQPIGKYTHQNQFTQQQFELKKGDALYLFSDGFADQFGGSEGKKFKYAPFKRSLLEIQNISMIEQGKYLEKLFFEWKGDLEQIDDVSVMGIKV